MCTTHTAYNTSVFVEQWKFKLNTHNDENATIIGGYYSYAQGNDSNDVVVAYPAMEHRIASSRKQKCRPERGMLLNINNYYLV